VISPSPAVRVHVPTHSIPVTRVWSVRKRPAVVTRQRETASTQTHGKKTRTAVAVKADAVKKKPVVAAKPLAPQSFSDKMVDKELAPGVVHRYFRGPLTINLIDIDMLRAPVKVQPYLAGDSFNHVKDVADHAKATNALAAINANYFKRSGVPLGTLIIDGEWVAGPLYDRVSMGITSGGYVRIDRVSFGGLLTTDNPDVPKAWVNNINQPRRSGCHLFLYTRRWGSFVKLPYDGALVAVDAQGKVMDTGATSMGIPWGGYVLADSKDTDISKLHRGDRINIAWQTKPDWNDIVQAVSGGPMLIKDGKLFLDLKDEKFRRGWTGSQIRARTVAGVTANNHLLLATVEGPHTLWDVAKFLHKLGVVDALNLDGGGSTTMVVQGKTVTRNSSVSQRRVPSSIVVLDTRNAPNLSTHIAPGSGLPGANAPLSQSLSTYLEKPATAPPLDQTGNSTQTQGISSPPAQTVDVVPAVTAEPEQPHKKKHFFGLLGH
jgi:uncharacterized protein YigE (DUF2233 family)